MTVKYTEIFKLAGMLASCGIPFDFGPHWISNKKGEKDGWVLAYGYPTPDGCSILSAVQFCGSYGWSVNLIETMGLLTPEEGGEHDVSGGLSAEDVFARIKKHYDENKNDEKGHTFQKPV